MPAITLLSPADFDTYTQRWQQLANGTDPATLQACFLNRDGQVLNYVYLANEAVVALLSAVGTVAIQLKFVAVPDTTRPGPAEAFSLAVYGVDAAGSPTSAYYLATVPARPAAVQPSTSNEAVPLDLAAAWVTNWAQLQAGELTVALFDSRTTQEPLLGYTYPLHDFLAALNQLVLPPNPALWLDFALHSYDNPGATVAGASRLFGMVLTLNSVPPDGESGVITLAAGQYYYDVAMPTPPG